MSRRLPPFAAVRAFEAAARHLSFKKAAEELCLSPSAISHQIRGLEDYLATSLFDRSGNSLSLSLTGKSYASRLTQLLDDLDNATVQAASTGSLKELRVLCTPGFAARWLVPRLGRFEMNERVRLRVSAGAPDVDFHRNEADVVIQWVDTPSDGNIVEPLMASARYPVASPGFVRTHDLSEPRMLCDTTLMHDEVQDAWSDWFRLAGLEPPELPRGPRFPNCEYSTTAAELGQGVSLAYDAMVRDTVRAGRLVRLFNTVTMPFTIYSICYPAARRGDLLIAAFRDWIMQEVAAERLRPQDVLMQVAE